MRTDHVMDNMSLGDAVSQACMRDCQDVWRASARSAENKGSLAPNNRIRIANICAVAEVEK